MCEVTIYIFLQISPLVFDTFLSRIQADYGCHGNPYHNATHGADVAQTMHYFIQHSSIKVCVALLSACSPQYSDSFQCNVY